MTLGELFLLYLIAGVAVAAAVYLTTRASGVASRGFQVATALFFWPFYLTLLVARIEPAGTMAPACDELARVMTETEAELAAALRRLDGWADAVRVHEKPRLDALRRAWAAHAQHVRALDRLLGQLPSRDDQAEISERVRASRSAVRENTERLRRVRDRNYQALLESLAWVRELASMLDLARFTDAPAARAEELLTRIAGAADTLTALAWNQEVAGEK